MIHVTLARQHHPLANSAEQLRILNSGEALPKFSQMLGQHDVDSLTARGIAVLQVNVGKACNQTCRHCHVDAGPERREIMSREIAESCIALLQRTTISTLDITGGAPEMNPH